MIRVNHEDRLLVMDRTFAKNASNVRGEECGILQNVRRDYPTYAVVTHSIKKNQNRETYAGLTYTYMENYIWTHGTGEARSAVLREYSELRLIAQCHGKARRYPAMKRWFLEKYPEVRDFGRSKQPAAPTLLELAPACLPAPALSAGAN